MFKERRGSFQQGKGFRLIFSRRQDGGDDYRLMVWVLISAMAFA